MVNVCLANSAAILTCICTANNITSSTFNIGDHVARSKILVAKAINSITGNWKYGLMDIICCGCDLQIPQHCRQMRWALYLTNGNLRSIGFHFFHLLLHFLLCMCTPLYLMQSMHTHPKRQYILQM